MELIPHDIHRRPPNFLKFTPAETLPVWTKKEMEGDYGTPKFHRQEIGSQLLGCKHVLLFIKKKKDNVEGKARV